MARFRVPEVQASYPGELQGSGVALDVEIVGSASYTDSADQWGWSFVATVNTQVDNPVDLELEEGDRVAIVFSDGRTWEGAVVPEPSRRRSFRTAGEGYPPFLSPGDPPLGVPRPSPEIIEHGLTSHSGAFLIQEVSARTTAIGHIQQALTALRDHAEEDDLDAALRDEAIGLLEELLALLTSERPAESIRKDRRRARRLVDGMESLAGVVRRAGETPFAQSAAGSSIGIFVARIAEGIPL